ncbi:hypothetical protein HanIR_Chr08g0386671 [Helianthus annuus]|nr:hypothetical protein HanIR_Chr08g0386671 [Helianthus annuus]
MWSSIPIISFVRVGLPLKFGITFRGGVRLTLLFFSRSKTLLRLTSFVTWAGRLKRFFVVLCMWRRGVSGKRETTKDFLTFTTRKLGNCDENLRPTSCSRKISDWFAIKTKTVANKKTNLNSVAKRSQIL